MIIHRDELEACIAGEIGAPHTFLGLHPLADRPGMVARAWDPAARKIFLINDNDSRSWELIKIDQRGFFELHLSKIDSLFHYSLLFVYEGNQEIRKDPYSFKPTVLNDSFLDFNKGLDRRPFTKLGAFPKTHQGIDGVSFVLWAPSAKSIHLVGDFNKWDTQSLPMRALGSSGCHELFVPCAKVGDKYKFRVLGFDGILREKTDPFGSRFEGPTGNASIIENCIEIKKRNNIYQGSSHSKPLSIYEIHLGSWRFHSHENRPLSYLELAKELPEYLNENGFSHVEFLPVSEYPFGASWGYQVTGYYAPTYRHGTPEDFSALISSIQSAGIGVIIDWVPAHFPSDEFALSRFDGTCLFEHEDPRQGQHAEWGTLCYNYGKPEVRSFLIGSAIAWLDRFGVDGFRVDAVASMLYLDYGRRDNEWIPNKDGGNYNLEAIDFLKQFNQAIHQEYPGVISIAEESTSFPQVTHSVPAGGLGFDFKWNMGWMHDVLSYFSTPPDKRADSYNRLTFGATYQFSEKFIQVFSHDEVVHGKGSLVNKMNLGSETDRIANLRALISLQWTWPGKKTLFMGSEFAQWREWDFNSPLDWELLQFPKHDGVRKLVADLNRLYNNHDAWSRYDCSFEKFKWVDCDDREGQTLSFLKFGELPQETLLIACNFSDRLQHREWRCPHPGLWHVIFDSDSPHYGGEGASGGTEFTAYNGNQSGQTHSISFSVNCFSVRILALR